MSRKSGFFSGLVWGALLGGAAALLYAPKTGKELREELLESAGEYRDLALERAEEYRDLAVEKGVNLYDAANSKTEEIKVSLTKSAQELKGQLDELTAEWQGKLQDELEEDVEDAETVITEFKEALEQQEREQDQA